MNLMFDPYTLASAIRPLMQGRWQKLSRWLMRRQIKRV